MTSTFSQSGPIGRSGPGKADLLSVVGSVFTGPAGEAAQAASRQPARAVAGTPAARPLPAGMEHFIRREANGCWSWVGPTYPEGSPVAGEPLWQPPGWTDPVPVAHVLYALHGGAHPYGHGAVWARHCGNPACVAPSHVQPLRRVHVRNA